MPPKAVNSTAVVRQIDEDTVKYIAAGEKINDIETAIRELIDNSIDAGAKNIEIRLARWGIEAIEVEDNGCGINEKDFNSLGQRYHTSKITDFKRVQDSLETFGFRGEALSCLCKIASLTITTKTSASPTGWKILFKKDGSISRTEPTARNNGTTVVIKNLFHSLPVRRRELETSAKKHYDKVVRLIYEHALARPHIKFSLSKKYGGRLEKDFAHGATNLQGCIVTIFGSKTFDSLLPISQVGQPLYGSEMVEDETKKRGIDSENEDNVGDDDGTSKRSCKQHTTHCSEQQSGAAADEDTCLKSQSVDDENRPAQSNTEFYKRSCKSKFARKKPIYRIHGYISKVGCGRNSNDCQFLFVNQKPCEIPKLARLINEIFKGYSANQNPFYCLFIQVQSFAADFNVPRKRAVILQDENKLCEIVEESLRGMFSSFAPASQKSCPIAQIPMKPQTTQASIAFSSPIRDELKKDFTRPNQDSINQLAAELAADVAATDIAPSDNETFANSASDNDGHPSGSSNAVSIPDPFEVALKKVKLSGRSSPVATKTTTSSSHVMSINDNNATNGFRSGLELLAEQRAKTKVTHDETFIDARSTSCEESVVSEIRAGKQSSRSTPNRTPKTRTSPAAKSNNLLPECRFAQVEMIQNNEPKVRLDYLEDLGAALERERAQRRMSEDQKQFSFAIHPKFNTVAEDELKFHLNKKSFESMQVIGQFNRGFVIARLNKHLFIIDQHATDERANYEDLLANPPLVKQAMVYPKPLYLNLIQENAILNNTDEFTKRGFEFKVDKTKLIGYRVMLTSTSICQGIGKDEHFGKSDIEELIDVAVESPMRLASYTLRKVREIVASRACRKSVMIGDKLTWQQMNTIVNKMAGLQNPWVCAHDRPTIRHLMDSDWMTK